MTPETEARIREIEARSEKATPGPWFQSETEHTGTFIFFVDAPDKRGVNGPWTSKNFIAPPDTSFIAHSRDDVPFLLTELRRTDERLGRACVMIDLLGLKPPLAWLNECESQHLTFDRSDDSSRNEVWRRALARAFLAEIEGEGK